MVSDSRRASYAAAVSATGETSAAKQNSPPMNSSPQRGTPQRNPAISQRSLASEEFDNRLYLHIGENPSAILVNPLLTSSNYSSWSISMRMALEVKNKWGLIDGSIPIPNQDQPQYSAWKRCNSMVKSWLLKSISPSIAQSVLYFWCAKDVWDDLKRRFSQGDPHRISQLQDEIYKLKQGNMNVTDYYTKCRTLWEEMGDLRPLPVCKCNLRCSCDLIDEIRREREADQIIRLHLVFLRIISRVSIKLLQMNEGLWPFSASTKEELGKYLCLNSLAAKDVGLSMSLQACLHRRAKLNSLRLLKPNPPQCLGTHKLDHGQ